jgi:hypothetical protein
LDAPPPPPIAAHPPHTQHPPHTHGVAETNVIFSSPPFTSLPQSSFMSASVVPSQQTLPDSSSLLTLNSVPLSVAESMLGVPGTSRGPAGSDSVDMGSLGSGVLGLSGAHHHSASLMGVGPLPPVSLQGLDHHQGSLGLDPALYGQLRPVPPPPPQHTFSINPYSVDSQR